MGGDEAPQPRRTTEMINCNTQWETTTCPRLHNNSNKIMIMQQRWGQPRMTATGNNNTINQQMRVRATDMRTSRLQIWTNMDCHKLEREQMRWNSCISNMQWWITSSSSLHTAPDLWEPPSMKSNTSGGTSRFNGQGHMVMGSTTREDLSATTTKYDTN